MNAPTWIRSPELMSADQSALLVIDVQQKLIPLIPEHERIVWNIRRLIDGGALFGVPAMLTEQYPKGLGPTVAELTERLPPAEEKITFSCGSCQSGLSQLEAAGRHQLLLAGIETHVCVQQTAFDLLARGFRVYLAVDATGSRGTLDRDVALRRLEGAGVVLTTTEAALFEWCQVAGTPAFKQLSRMIQEPPPESIAKPH